jgi:hypothetical protein
VVLPERVVRFRLALRGQRRKPLIIHHWTPLFVNHFLLCAPPRTFSSSITAFITDFFMCCVDLIPIIKLK